MIVETCDDLITKENDELKQEVERLMADLRRLKRKYTQEQAQPSQDNPLTGVKKLEKGETVTCFKCCKKRPQVLPMQGERGQSKGQRKWQAQELEQEQ